MTRCNKKQIKHGCGTIAKYAKRISNKVVRCCKIWTAIRFQVEWIAAWRDFQPRMTRCNKNKKFGSGAANFSVERFVADRSVRLTLPSNHLPPGGAPAPRRCAERDGNPGADPPRSPSLFSAARQRE
jgi:hypothetical protein